jgi:hypothetical protein
MLAAISKNKLQYLVAILIVVAVLSISAYRSGAVTRVFNEGRQAPAAMIYGPPGR